MSTQFNDTTGQPLAVRYWGGQDRGICLDVFMPYTVFVQFGHQIMTYQADDTKRTLTAIHDDFTREYPEGRVRFGEAARL